MKNIKHSFFIIFLALNIHFAQGTPPGDGDIIFTQISSSNNFFEFVTLADNLDLSSLRITENGVNNIGEIETSLGEAIFIFSEFSDPIWTNVPGGTFIRVDLNGGSDTDPLDRILQVNSGLLSGTFSLNNFGDQLIAYVGTESSPIFIAATNYSRANVKWIKKGAIDELTSYSPGTSSNLTLTKGSNFYFNGYVDGNKWRTQQTMKIPSNWTLPTSLTEFQDLSKNIGNSLLPVELTSFEATPVKGGVMLNWSTATEVNNYGFEIERSNANKWEKIGFVEGHGNSYSPKDYSFYDDSPLPGSSVYRLKQIDTDGGYEYSFEAEVTSTISQKIELYQNHPNPFNPGTTISFSLPELSYVTLIIYNAIGEKIEELANDQFEAGHYTLNFDASYLSSGFYFYRLETPNYAQTRKMVLIK